MRLNKKVAKVMKKSVLSCTIFHYGLGQKRQTRRSRTATSILQRTPLPNINITHEHATLEKDCKWDFHVSELIKYKNEFGHTLVPKVFPPNQCLSSWVFKIRGYVYFSCCCNHAIMYYYVSAAKILVTITKIA